MKAIMVMFDSLNRRMLPPYGCSWVHAPNFQRLAEKTVVFDTSYTCSLPCMPARRELHTGRPNFLHRGWGPVEPFDDSMPEILKNNGVYSHLSSDHYHYWEDGGCTYHTRYTTWEFFRGQEGDPWIGQVADLEEPETVASRGKSVRWRQDWVNRAYMTDESLQPQAGTFSAGLDFIRRNQGEDRWFLHIETFDPHEPFFTQKKYKDLYPHKYNGRHFDWPPYRKTQETPEEIEHCRYEYAALVSMCDSYLGTVLDLMDELDLWKDTMLIVNTDHGFMLGEHECWAKCWQPFYNEIANTPLFIWDPRSGCSGERRESLVQTIDLAPTVMEFFDVALTEHMIGKSLRETIAHDTPVREAGIFGIHGGHVNVTDGRYIYMRGPVRADNQPLYNYTLMPTHMAHLFSVEELQNVALAEPFSFTKGCRTLKIPAAPKISRGPNALENYPTMLFDLKNDPEQNNPIQDEQVEKRMLLLLRRCLQEGDAPEELYERLGL